MRILRDFDSELKALDDRAKSIKARKVQQLGELVIACRADALDAEVLAGALLVAVTADAVSKEAWRQHGAAFFRGKARSTARGPHSRARSASPDGSSAQPAAGDAGTP